MKRIETISGLTIDFERLKFVHQQSEILKIEYVDRIEYSKNPFNGELEKNVLVDKIIHEFYSTDSAGSVRQQIEDYWNEYVSSK